MRYTKQQAVDKVAAHLRAQGKQALGTSGRCAYRGVNGLSCAIGCLDIDEVYQPSWEDTGASYLFLKQGLNTVFYTRDSRFATGLQSLHDKLHHWGSIGFNSTGEQAVKEFCRQWKIKYPEPPKEA